MADVTICDHGCSSLDGCSGNCGNLPPRMVQMPDVEFDKLLSFANRVQCWSFERTAGPTFAEAADHFGVGVERIADAVMAHYWMYTPDTDLPLDQRRIEHDGE